jgi:hypothetical protein
MYLCFVKMLRGTWHTFELSPPRPPAAAVERFFFREPCETKVP